MTRREPDPEWGGLVGRKAWPRQQANLPASHGLLQVLLLLLQMERLWEAGRAWVVGRRLEVDRCRWKWKVGC